VHPAFFTPDLIEFEGAGYRAKSAADIFGYKVEWCAPTEANARGLLEVMGQPLPPLPAFTAAASKDPPAEQSPRRIALPILDLPVVQEENLVTESPPPTSDPTEKAEGSE
jgi:hypothetical protein